MLRGPAAVTGATGTARWGSTVFRAVVLLAVGFFVGLQVGLYASHTSVMTGRTDVHEAAVVSSSADAPAAPSVQPPPPVVAAAAAAACSVGGPNPCGPNGRCVVAPTTAAAAASGPAVVSCVCNRGWRGALCTELDAGPCARLSAASVPLCYNGGRCVFGGSHGGGDGGGVDVVFCECPREWTGVRCTVRATATTAAATTAPAVAAPVPALPPPPRSVPVTSPPIPAPSSPPPHFPVRPSSSFDAGPGQPHYPAPECRALCNWTYTGPAPPGFAFHNAVGQYVCPTSVRDVADYVFFWPFDHYTFEPAVWHHPLHGGGGGGGHPEAGIDAYFASVARCLRPGAVIYLQTLSWEGKPLKWFAEKLAPLLTQKFILITGEADEDPVREEQNAGNALLKSPHLIHWFAQHVPSPRTKLEPLPLGINCFEHGPELHAYLSERASATAIPPPLLPAPSTASATATTTTAAAQGGAADDRTFRRSGPVLDAHVLPPHRIPPKLLVVNFDLGTHNSRRAVWRHFCGDAPHNGQAVWEQQKREREAAAARARGDPVLSSPADTAHHLPPKPWADCPAKQVRNLMRRNGHLKQHYTRLSEYKYWLCPRGNGLDTHRTWEALYVGAVPIVQRSGLDPLFADGDLPVLVVDDFRELTEQFLVDTYERRFRDWSKFPRRKLTRAYWIDRIATVRQRGLVTAAHSPDHALPLAAATDGSWAPPNGPQDFSVPANPPPFSDAAVGYQCWGYRTNDPAPI